MAVAVLVSDYVQRDFERHEAALAASPDIFWGVLEDDGEQPSLVVQSGRPGAIQAIDVKRPGRLGATIVSWWSATRSATSCRRTPS